MKKPILAELPENVEFKPIPNYPKYYCGSDGSVFIKTQNGYREKTYHTVNSGYLMVQLSGEDYKLESMYIHILVAKLFVAPIRNRTVIHLDGNKLNNTANNLGFIKNHSEAMKRAWNNGRFKKTLKALKKARKAKNNRVTNLTKTDVVQIRYLREEGYSNAYVGKLYNLHPNSISKIYNRKTWNKVP